MKNIFRVILLITVFLLAALIMFACNSLHDVSYTAHVWEDLNQNGQEDTDERPVPGITIQIINHTNGILWHRSKTDMNGNIEAFSAGGTCGQYDIYLSVPDGYWPTTSVVLRPQNCQVAKFGIRQLP